MENNEGGGRETLADMMQILMERFEAAREADEVCELAYDLTKRTAEYIKDNRIEDVVLLDRSARPFATAFNTYWRLAFPEEKKPKVFFLNPDALAEEKSGEELEKQFGKEHPYLFEDREKPVFVFDLCAHRGGTLRKTDRGMKAAGFSNVTFGLAFDDRDPKEREDFPVGFALRVGGEQVQCNLFGTDEFLTKGDKLHSEIADGQAKDARMNSLMAFYMRVTQEGEDRYWNNPRMYSDYVYSKMNEIGMTREEEKSLTRRLESRSVGQRISSASDRLRAMDTRKGIIDLVTAKFNAGGDIY